MLQLISRYTHWLHTQWPAGLIEKLPVVQQDGTTSVPGLYVVGDLTGIPLLKFSADTGARAVQAIITDNAFTKRKQQENVHDLIIVGGGVAGIAAAIEAKKKGLDFKVYEGTQAFSTIVNFPKGKPIFTYPTDMTPAGELQFNQATNIKESLLDVLYQQVKDHDIELTHEKINRVQRKSSLLVCHLDKDKTVKAHRVIVAIGRSGNFRKLGVPGEDLDKVYNRLHDPKDYAGQNTLVVGGGDSALETAIALALGGSHVTLSYRKPEFARPKPDNIDSLEALRADPTADVQVSQPTSERVNTAAGSFMPRDKTKPGSIHLMMASQIKNIEADKVKIVDSDGKEHTLANDAVFTMIGREAPLGFFKQSGVPVHGQWRASTWISFILIMLFVTWMYHWKKNFFTSDTLLLHALDLNPAHLWDWITAQSQMLTAWASDPASFFSTLKLSASGRGFYYSLAYCLGVVIFGIRRIRRRKTPYVTRQTLVLMFIQCFFLFLVPVLILPWMGQLGAFEGGPGKWVGDQLFPVVSYGHGREYWRAYGLILAWPLFAYNFFTDQPIWAWLVLGSVQTFVVIPIMIFYWGKGAYCGWICSCGALAETVGDTHRHKMPHGPLFNKLNMIGQVFLWFSVLLMLMRIGSWIWPASYFQNVYDFMFTDNPVLNFKWTIDLLFAGIIGVGMYWHFSGRVWCRFACPLAALMHIYARFSRFRIFANKKKCISCNVCTSVCHQGIDVMNFANKGLPMQDPQCVRCSACVQSCPTGVLSFGQINRATGDILKLDTLAASPVQMAQLTINGRCL